MMLAGSAGAQEEIVLQDVLREIAANNLTLAAARSQLAADRMENDASVRLDDPEIDLGYQWGDPVAVPNRTQITVMQPFDFSTIFGQKRRLADAQNRLLDVEYRQTCIELLIEAGNLYEDACLYRLLDTVITRRLVLVERETAQSARQLETGETDLIHHQKAQMILMRLRAEAAANRMDYRDAMDGLKRLNGGKEVSGRLCMGDLLALPADFEAWYAASTEHIPEAQLARQAVEVSRRQLSQTRTDALPGLSVGYVGELVTDNNYHGFQLGLSVPLWSAAPRLREAKERLESAELRKQDALMQLHESLKTVYEQAQAYLSLCSESKEILDNLNYIDLLEASFAKGELSIFDYSAEMDELLETVETAYRSLHSYNKLALTLLLQLGAMEY